MARARPWCVPCITDERSAKARRNKSSDHEDCEVLVPIRKREGVFQILRTSPSACLCFLACLRSVKGGLAEIRVLRRPSVCRISWQEAEHKGCVSAWEVLQVTKSCGAGTDFAF